MTWLHDDVRAVEALCGQRRACDHQQSKQAERGRFRLKI